MKSYLIGYDLNKSGQDYTSLIKEIKQLGLRWYCLDSTWIIKSNSTAKNIRNHLQKFIDSNDELLVAKLNREAAWTGFDEKCSKWLNDNL